ncbi:HAD family hydrolase [Acaryochloris sp. CCMEE 5410]|uniref:HAD family hydrolase n=1 Tax=Acaryochloris sp. CCMEE 5410 TaxID=310037 RepID=UPI0002484AC2|nr:HAD family hydrolase [Acaryochloris sp. CCMEE 5410]KAI9132273.1 HAD family hydrolase [Acaryochloris sp. CCMEE 5410]
MTQATQPVANRIAIAFDFDETLVPNSYDAFLEYLGYDVSQFRQARYEPLKEQGWDGIPARFHTLVQASQERPDGQKITRETLKAFGQQLQPFPGVTDMFGRLRQQAQAIVPDIDVEFYLITSGFVEIARHSAIAPYFKAMWGCEFHYSDIGEVQCLKCSVTHAEKTRYLNYLSKGIENHTQDDLLFVYQDVPEEKLHVPFSQVIYVGDGTSDLPCFELLNRTGGIAIGVFAKGTAADWSQEYQVSRSQRVTNLALADYSEGAELMQSLTLAVESISKKVALLQFGHGE